MEHLDRKLLLEVIPKDPTLKKLYSEHVRLEKEVLKYQKYSSYSPSAALKEKSLKKKKLQGKEELMRALERYRKAA